jgi:hypothetical protein
MDKQTLAVLIPVIALTIPVVAIVFGSLVKMARLKADTQRHALASPEVEARMAALEEEVVSLRQELIETQERLDFTERLLTRQSEQRPQ